MRRRASARRGAFPFFGTVKIAVGLDSPTRRRNSIRPSRSTSYVAGTLTGWRATASCRRSVGSAVRHCGSGASTEDRLQMNSDSPGSAQEVLAGLVERVTFHNEENGFCLLRTKARGHRDLVTVVGQAARLASGSGRRAIGSMTAPTVSSSGRGF